jgi:succinate-acetate transporter protein
MGGKSIGEHTHIVLQPVAGVSMLGFFAFAVAAFVAGAQIAGWRGFATAPSVGSFFAMLFGFAQFAAAMWAFKARDGASTAFHGVWGAFWVGFGLLNVFFLGAAAAPGPATLLSWPLAYCFLALAFVSGACAAAALATNFVVFGTMLGTALASLAVTLGIATASMGLATLGGYLFVLSALFAWYGATAMMIEDSFGYAVLPVGEFKYSREAEPISEGLGEPGVLHGEWRGYARKSVSA